MPTLKCTNQYNQKLQILSAWIWRSLLNQSMLIARRKNICSERRWKRKREKSGTINIWSKMIWMVFFFIRLRIHFHPWHLFTRTQEMEKARWMRRATCVLWAGSKCNIRTNRKRNAEGSNRMKIIQTWHTYCRDILIFRYAMVKILFIVDPLATMPNAIESPKNVCNSTKSWMS